MKNLSTLFQAICLVALPLWAGAQTQLLSTPNASQKASVSQTVGLTDMEVIYHRPMVNKREVWGKLVPYGQVWRAGANDNTTITFSTDVMVEGQPLAAGTYGLHMIPNEKDCTVIFSKNNSAWGSFSYNPAEDALRVPAKLTAADHFYEYLTYDFEGVSADAATCMLSWGDKSIPFQVKVDLENTVVPSIRHQLQNKAGFSWQGWNEAANFCLQNDFNHQEALTWATRSVFIQPTPQNMLVKARLTGKVNNPGNEAEAQKTVFATLDQDLQTFPTTWREYHAAATYATQQENWEKAVSWEQKSVDMSPNMTNMMALSGVWSKKGDETKAKKMKADALARGSNTELNNYGYQLLGQGNMAEAIEVFEMNTKKNPTDPNVWDSLGEGYFNNNQKDKAAEAFKKSLSLNPPANVKANSLKFLEAMGVKADTIKP